MPTASIAMTSWSRQSVFVVPVVINTPSGASVIRSGATSPAKNHVSAADRSRGTSRMTSQEFVESNHNKLVKYLQMVRDGSKPLESTKEWKEVVKLLEDLDRINDSGYSYSPHVNTEDYL